MARGEEREGRTREEKEGRRKEVKGIREGVEELSEVKEGRIEGT